MQSLTTLTRALLPKDKEPRDGYGWDRLIAISEKTEVDSEDGDDASQYRRIHARHRPSRLPKLIILILSISTAAFAFAYFTKKPTDRECDAQLSVWCKCLCAFLSESGLIYAQHHFTMLWSMKKLILSILSHISLRTGDHLRQRSMRHGPGCGSVSRMVSVDWIHANCRQMTAFAYRETNFII